MVSLRTPLTGDEGTLILSSPSLPLEIRLANPPTIPVSALVHATNSSMTLTTTSPSHDSSLLHAAGSELRFHLRYNHPSGLKPGSVLCTPSFELKNCGHVIHVNAPSFHRRGRRKESRRCIPLLKQLLADCYRKALEEAYRLGAESVAFSCLGTGMRGWPTNEAARIGVSVVRGWLRHRIHGATRREVIKKVVFLADERGAVEAAWVSAFREFWPVEERRRSFGEYVDRQEIRRLGRDTGRLVENGGVVLVARAEELKGPVVGREIVVRTREVRRSGRVRKIPERYGQ